MTEPTRRHLLSSDGFIDWLRRQGIIPELTRRVVIDIQAGNVVLIYIEQFASTEMIELDAPSELKGAEIRLAARPATDATV